MLLGSVCICALIYVLRSEPNVAHSCWGRPQRAESGRQTAGVSVGAQSDGISTSMPFLLMLLPSGVLYAAMVTDTPAPWLTSSIVWITPCVVGGEAGRQVNKEGRVGEHRK